MSREQILIIHLREMDRVDGPTEIRDPFGLDACVEAPKATYNGEYLYDLFEMAASICCCLSIRHPFLDGNKRVALASSLVFLYLNGFQVEESHDLELAELVLSFLAGRVDQASVATHFRTTSSPRNNSGSDDYI